MTHSLGISWMQRRQLSFLVLCALTLTILNSASLPIEQTSVLDRTPSVSETEDVLLSSNNYPDPMDISGNTYSDHLRITITSNSEFLALKTVEVWDGTTGQGHARVTGHDPRRPAPPGRHRDR